mmetsp:Transcript_1717/g.6191  ORF Transcript_1717/g.6191 Transcript_1717/m.6191 type:complete len:213 (-) Transcript_1717:1664-2302(-)
MIIAAYGLLFFGSTLAKIFGKVPTTAMPYVMRLVVDNSVQSKPTVLIAAPIKNTNSKADPPTSFATSVNVPSSHFVGSANTEYPTEMLKKSINSANPMAVNIALTNVLLGFLTSPAQLPNKSYPAVDHNKIIKNVCQSGPNDPSDISCCGTIVSFPKHASKSNLGNPITTNAMNGPKLATANNTLAFATISIPYIFIATTTPINTSPNGTLN